jgi:hypothetical protein
MSQCNHVAAKFGFDNTRSGKMPNGRCELRERLMHNKNAIFEGVISGFWIDQGAQSGPLSSRLTVEAFVGHAYYRGSPTATYSADGLRTVFALHNIWNCAAAILWLTFDQHPRDVVNI